MSRTALCATACLLLAAGILTIVTAASLSSRKPDVSVSKVRESKSTPVDAPTEWMTEYSLTERSGRQFHSKELNDKVHVVNFFFSTCPSVCRMQSNKVSQLVDEFGPQGVVFLSITCDPERDTPEVLQQYAKMYDADDDQWLFLTSSDLLYLRRVGAEVYQLPVDKQIHSENLAVLDKWGKIRGHYNWNKLPEVYEMRKALDQLLSEQEPPPPESPVLPEPDDQADEDVEPVEDVDEEADDAADSA